MARVDRQAAVIAGGFVHFQNIDLRAARSFEVAVADRVSRRGPMALTL